MSTEWETECERDIEIFKLSAGNLLSESRELIESAEDYQATLDRYHDSFQKTVDDVNEKMNLYNECHKRVAKENIRKVTTVNKLVEDLEKINLERDIKQALKERATELESNRKSFSNLLYDVEVYPKTKENPNLAVSTSITSSQEWEFYKKKLEDICEERKKILNTIKNFGDLETRYKSFEERLPNFNESELEIEVKSAWDSLTNQILCNRVKNLVLSPDFK